MRFFLACLSLGLFSWLSYGVFFGTLEFGAAGNPQAEALNAAIQGFIEGWGVEATALGLLGAGAVVSFLVIAVGAKGEA